MYLHIHRSTVAQVWRSEGNQWVLVLSFHHEDSGGRTQVVRFGEKCQYLLSHLTSQLPCLLPSCLLSFLSSLYWVVCRSGWS